MPPLSSVIASPASDAAAAATSSTGSGVPAPASARRRVGRGLGVVVAFDGEAERLAALAAALEQVFGYFGHGLFASLRA